MELGFDVTHEKPLYIEDENLVVVLGRNDDFIKHLVLETNECLLIDTRGIDILPYCSRVNETIYFNPKDKEFPVAFNPLNPSNKHDNSLEILHTFRTLFHNSWGPQLEMILTASLRAVLDNPQPTFLKMYMLLTNENYRRRLHLDDPFIESFWKSYGAWEDREKFQRTQSTLSKLFSFLHHPTTRNILSQPNKINFTNKTVIADLSGIPRDLQRLLGSLLIPHSKRVVVTDAAAFALPHRTAMTLEYTNYPKKDWDTLVLFRVRGADREAVAKELNLHPNEIARLNEGVYAIAEGKSHIIEPSAPTKQYNKEAKIIEQTHRRYCTPRKALEATLGLFVEHATARPRVSRGALKKWKS